MKRKRNSKIPTMFVNLIDSNNINGSKKYVINQSVFENLFHKKFILKPLMFKR